MKMPYSLKLKMKEIFGFKAFHAKFFTQVLLYDDEIQTALINHLMKKRGALANIAPKNS